jgi:hypothetical protein
MSIPQYWLVSWVDPKTGQTHEKKETQRSVARGLVIMRRAMGMLDVSIKPVGY